MGGTHFPNSQRVWSPPDVWIGFSRCRSSGSYSWRIRHYQSAYCSSYGWTRILEREIFVCDLWRCVSPYDEWGLFVGITYFLTKKLICIIFSYEHTNYIILASYSHLTVWYFCLDIFPNISQNPPWVLLSFRGIFLIFRICISTLYRTKFGKISGIIFSRIGGRFFMQYFCKTISSARNRRILFTFILIYEFFNKFSYIRKNMNYFWYCTFCAERSCRLCCLPPW